MTSLVPGVVFPTPGLNRRSTRVSNTATPSEIDAKYARAPLNGTPWPRSSPVARVYDICNTSTKLILYNNERSRTGTHLRGQTKAAGSIRKPSPDRHQSPEPRVNRYHHSQCTVSKTERFQPRPHSKLSWRDKPILYDNKSPVNPKYHAPCKVSRDSEGLRWERPRPYRRPRSTTSLPPYMCGSSAGEREFTKGEKTYLWSIARIYSVDNLKRLKQDQYMKLLAQEKQRGTHSKAEYQRYMSYLNSPRRLTSAPTTRRRPSPPRGKDKPSSPGGSQRQPQRRSFPRRLNDSFSSQTSSSTLQSRGSSTSASRASARSSVSSRGHSSLDSRDRTPRSSRSASQASPTPRSAESTPRQAEPKEEKKDADEVDKTPGDDDKIAVEDKKVEGEEKVEEEKAVEEKKAEEEEKAEEDKKDEEEKKADEDVKTDEKEKADEEKAAEEEAVSKEAPEDRSAKEEEHTEAEESRAKEQEAEGDTAREEGRHQLSLLKQIVPDKSEDQPDEDDFDSQTATDLSSKEQERAEDSKKEDADTGRESKPVTKGQEEITPRSTSSEKHQEGRDRPKSRIGRTNKEGRRVASDSDDDYDTDFESEGEEEGTKSDNETSASQQESSQRETYTKLAPPPGEQEAGQRADYTDSPKGDGSEGYVVYTDRRQGEGDRAPEVPPGTETYTKVEGSDAAPPAPSPSPPPPDPDARGDNAGSPASPSPPPAAPSLPAAFVYNPKSVAASTAADSTPAADPTPAAPAPSPVPAQAPSPAPADQPPSTPRRKDSIEEGREERTEVNDVDKIEY